LLRNLLYTTPERNTVSRESLKSNRLMAVLFLLSLLTWNLELLPDFGMFVMGLAYLIHTARELKLLRRNKE
jgi:hypothetical protein